MTANSLLRILFVVALLMSVCICDAQAWCCGGGTTAFYPSTTFAAQSPVVFQTTSTGWYPGYWWNRIGTRLWGSPSTYVVARPVVVQPTVAFRPAYSVGHTVSYAAPAPACATCTTQTVAYAPAPIQAVTMQPACTAGCDPCAAGAGYGATGVVQAVHQEPAGCASCAPGVVVAPPAPAVAAPPAGSTPPPASVQQQTYESQNAAPSLDPGASVPDRQQDAKRPETNGQPQQVQPAPASDIDSDSDAPYKENGESSTYFQAPELFDPNDRTASRSVPVTNAIYEKPIAYRTVSFRPITRQQAEQDAAGWVSASK